ncbi:HAD family hydrolase [Pseudoponticoccus marisrubri]|uniref:phosphoglycolate phosphatase n=1 Tax=Pseudoponticoccus marisrubri TaxID=1685382 RepID=A0A0W7WNV0_9RHOB|nr:HAD family hydrolase [Pseudoponticoccus marisrubri]KUF12168.1 phosphatase [Pseudoponticoccus marisrubri]
MRPRVDAVLFDKDGTLFDFEATWNVWAGQVVAALSGGDHGLAARLAAAARYDLAAGRYFPDSPVIAGTNAEAAACLATELPGWRVEEIEQFLVEAAADAPLAEPVPLVPLLAELAAMDLSLGVVTNDSESVARAHLTTAGILRVFDFIAGADSGYGAKPAPEPLWAFARATGHAPDRVVMVGDSTHDLRAGRAAGMWCVGVLTGLATAEALSPFADVVLPHIGHLPAWLQGAPVEND